MALPPASPQAADLAAWRRDSVLLKLLVALGVAFWLVAFVWYRGSLALWSDDWWFIARNPETREIVGGNLLQLPTFFWRPLFIIWTRLTVTGLSEYPQVLHLLAAGVHGAVCTTLFLASRRLGLSVLGSSIAALLALTCPTGWEVPFWATGVPTGLGCGLMLVLIVAGARAGLSRAGRLRWALMVGGCGLMSFAVPCLNEQPAAGVLALPFAAAAMRRGRLPVRVWCVWTVCLAAIVAYVALYWVYGPGTRGKPNTLIHPGEILDRLRTLVPQVRNSVLLDEFRRGAAETGWMVLKGSVTGWLAATAIAVCGGAVVRCSIVGSSDQGRSRSSAGWTVLTGCVIALASVLPILVVRNQGVDPRGTYMGALGLALAVGGCLDAVNWSARRNRRVVRGVAAGGLLLVCALGAVMTLGVQHVRHQREELDSTEASSLLDAIPDPRPGSIIVPLRIDAQTAWTRSQRFNIQVRGPLEYAWSTPAWVRRVYRRADLRATFWSPWHAMLIVGAEPRGLVWKQPDVPHFDRPFTDMPLLDDGSVVLRWEQAIPIVIDARGQVHVVDRVVVQSSGLAREEFAVPQAAALHATGRAACTVTLEAPGGPAGARRVHFEPSP